MAAAKATIDHDTIREWVEARGGCPAAVKGTGTRGTPGILRIDYTGFSGQTSLEKIPWEDFFEAFDENDLAFLYQDQKDSRFSKLVSRRSVNLDEATEEEEDVERKSCHAVQLLETQHREIEALFSEYENAKDKRRKQRTFDKIADAFAAHSKIEETIFYPEVMTEATEDELREAVEEHLSIKRVIADLMEIDPSDEQWDGKIQVLQEQINHHVQEEENKIFALVENFEEDDFRDMGERMLELYEELMDGEPRYQVPNETGQAAQL